jgi:fructuronate reductase
MNRLNRNNLHQLPASVIGPAYDVNAIKPGIVHLGIGAFHRAHQAFYTEAVMNQWGGDWGILGCSLRSPSVRDQLAPQDNYYTLVERSNTGEKIQLIGAVRQTLVGPEDPTALINLMADPAIKIISMTVTEKGYCHDPATGKLNWQHPDIQQDLQNLQQPKSAIGFLVASLQQRANTHATPVTLLSCDNLPNNGEILEGVVLEFAEKISPQLASWIKNSIAFPGTMIDRIVPATTDEDRNEIENQLGLRDEGMVICEPFSQWVIEDKFANARPAWEKVGALLVDDVRIFEKIKLRLLNGSHSLMAYTGYLAGFEYIYQVMQAPAFVNMVTRYMAEDAGVTINPPQGFDIESYKQQLRERFSNRALKHRTWQIAMDGSQKLPQRILESLRENLAAEKPVSILCLAIAAWIRYVTAVDEKGQVIDVRDPFAAELREICDQHQNQPESLVRAMFGFKPVFGDDLIQSEKAINQTIDWLTEFYKNGVLKTIETYFGK